MSQVAGDP
uniref:Uncharacterized protein MANES_17G121600 n=1 Tax=Rhizophora mucronata TaxID=61149 RepID=A0A2P2LJI1_RHIMU